MGATFSFSFTKTSAAWQPEPASAIKAMIARVRVGVICGQFARREEERAGISTLGAQK